MAWEKQKGKSVVPEKAEQPLEFERGDESEDDLDFSWLRQAIPVAQLRTRKTQRLATKPQSQSKRLGAKPLLKLLRAKKEAEEQKRAEGLKLKQQKQKENWFKQVDALSACEGNKGKQNLSCMASMAQTEIRSAKVSVKKLGGHSGLEQSLDQLPIQKWKMLWCLTGTKHGSSRSWSRQLPT